MNIEDIIQMLDVSSVNNINTISLLKKKYPQYPINEILTLIKLREKYLPKLKISNQWILTEKNAQQASSYLVAKYHGTLFSKFSSVADLCCGIGMDLMFLSENKKCTYAVDLDPHILISAQYNMKMSSPDKYISFLNIKAEEFNEDVEAVFIDPDRRTNEKRNADPLEMSPSINSVELIIHQYQNIAVKLSPMIDYEKQTILSQHQLQFVSENNELKEILLCTGKLNDGIKRKCIILPENICFDDQRQLTDEISTICKYLIEPNVAIIKAHLVEHLAYEIKAKKIDQHLALLTSDDFIDTPMAKSYEVNDIFDFSVNMLNKYISANHIEILDIKTRGFSETVESFRKKLKLKKGTKQAVLFIIRFEKKHLFIICNLKDIR